MIFNRTRDILDILRNFAEFFKHESCGVCTPCRAGNFIVQRKLDKIGMNLASREDFDDLKSWGKIMKLTSRCGLGKSATNALVKAIEKFPEYFESKVEHDQLGIRKSFNLEAAVQEYETFGS